MPSLEVVYKELELKGFPEEKILHPQGLYIYKKNGLTKS